MRSLFINTVRTAQAGSRHLLFSGSHHALSGAAGPHTLELLVGRRDRPCTRRIKCMYVRLVRMCILKDQNDVCMHAYVRSVCKYVCIRTYVHTPQTFLQNRITEYIHMHRRTCIRANICVLISDLVFTSSLVRLFAPTLKKGVLRRRCRTLSCSVPHRFAFLENVITEIAKFRILMAGKTYWNTNIRTHKHT